ncbi:hypothetical protein [Lentzea sp. NPDC060358]|uniref:hypothetical protein n=1 Tax=Lentzea sp. NPDC060358 TaxID=3347103 RepID=UPI00364EE3E8
MSWQRRVPPTVRELFHQRARRAALQLMALKDHDHLPALDAAEASLVRLAFCQSLLDRITLTACREALRAGAEQAHVAARLNITESALHDRLAAGEPDS